MTRYRVGVDIGGTFTDIVFLGEDGRRLTKKVSSTVDNYATAIVDGLTELTRACHGVPRQLFIRVVRPYRFGETPIHAGARSAMPYRKPACLSPTG